VSVINLKKPRLRWLFGGVGFQNSEATMTGIMSDSLYHEVFCKTFREISPTFSRVFAGYADWTREAMDAFADYYDDTFRKAGTVLYAAPGRMPMPTASFDVGDYCENVAERLAYLIKERKLTKLRYYCCTNEMSCGNTYAYLSRNLDLFARLHEGLCEAFRRHSLDVGLLACDSSGFMTDFNEKNLSWAINSIDEVTECYCAHTYGHMKYFEPGNLGFYDACREMYSRYVQMVLKREKRFVLGEMGLKAPWQANSVMINDVCLCVDRPADEAVSAVMTAEMTMAAINAGCLATVYWTMFDYPDPMLRENGDTPEEKARYDTARFSGHGLGIRYNKNGLVRWCDDEADYSPRLLLYTMGYMAKLFRKGSRVLEAAWDDKHLRCAAVTNADGSMSAAIINWAAAEQSVTVHCEHRVTKPLRVYVYDAANPPKVPCGDLQPYTQLIQQAEDGSFTVDVPAAGMVFVTTDYVERTPNAVVGLSMKSGRLCWKPSSDAEHCYYRVYLCDKQVASTTAEYIRAENPADLSDYRVYSVDRWGNCAKT